MIQIQEKRRNKISAVIAAVLIAVACFAWTVTSRSAGSEDAARAIREAVMDRAMQCYVIEGAYPESLDYLTENYGLAVNTEDYQVIYIAYAENLPPEVKVVPLG